MTPEARALFMRVADGQEPWLWDYDLIRNGEVLITVSDYSDRTVSENFLKEYMQKVLESWFEPIPEPEPKQTSERADEVLKLFMEEMKKQLSDLAQDQSEKKEP